MRKLSLLLLFIIVMVIVSQLENFQNAINTAPANGIPVTFYLAMGISLVIMIVLWSSWHYIKKIKKSYR